LSHHAGTAAELENLRESSFGFLVRYPQESPAVEGLSHPRERWFARAQSLAQAYGNAANCQFQNDQGSAGRTAHDSFTAASGNAVYTDANGTRYNADGSVYQRSGWNASDYDAAGSSGRANASAADVQGWWWRSPDVETVKPPLVEPPGSGDRRA
jgi:hypothetical protein